MDSSAMEQLPQMNVLHRPFVIAEEGLIYHSRKKARARRLPAHS